MTLYHIITIINWIVVAGLGIILLLEKLSPSRGGGDAAGRAIGQAISSIAQIAFVILLILNLLPFQWAHYTATALLILPLLFFKITPVINRIRKYSRARAEYAKPIYDDKNLDKIARAIRDCNPDKVKNLLENVPDKTNAVNELLGYAVAEANMNDYKKAEKLQIIQLLFDAGAVVDDADKFDSPFYMGAASSGNVDLLRMLLDHGADANARNSNLNTTILQEAADAWKEPEATVRLLLEHGAQTEATRIYDNQYGAETALVHAARMGRWGVCLALLEHGANIDFTNLREKSFHTYYKVAKRGFNPDGYSTKEDFARLEKWVDAR